MGRIPKPKASKNVNITPDNLLVSKKNKKIVFSFESIDKNEYFNLDGTCQNWAADLFDTLQKVSNIEVKDIYAGKYSGKNSTLRIHPHENANAPCKLPPNVSLQEMFQIRISTSKGGIHGILRENVFYVIWFDPHHNLYPDKNHGGLKRITPPSTCCKERDKEIIRLQEELKKAKEEAKLWEDYANELK